MGMMKIAFLDVGHGDFAYATTPAGHNLVIDVGSGDVVPSQFLSKIASISEVQVSHPHTDHFDDIIAISAKSIRSFRCPSLTGFEDRVIGWRKSDKAKIAKLREMKGSLAADDNAVPTGNGFNHTVWFAGGVDKEDPNTASCVTTLEYGGIKVLFGGDLPESGWHSLLTQPRFVNAIRGTTVFKVPHHGRKDGCCEALFKVIEPTLCIISDKPLGKDNKNTACTEWYKARSSGCTVNGCETKRKVLTTRSDKSIFMQVDETGKWWVYANTQWRNN